MDNRRLIDADALVEVIKNRIKQLPGSRKDLGGYHTGKLHAYENIILILTEEGQMYDPDPIPTIKPGDEVRHVKHPEWGVGEVNRLHGAGISATVYFSNVPYVPRYHRLSDLEVISQ